MSDVRPGAWMAAAALLEAADDVIRQHGEVAYTIADRVIARAAVYADLARADKEVGVVVGAAYEKAEQDKKRSAFQDALAKKRGGDKDGGGATDTVRPADTEAEDSSDDALG
jgi:hypothetical protein